MDTTDIPKRTEVTDEDTQGPFQEILIKEEPMDLLEDWERLGDFKFHTEMDIKDERISDNGPNDGLSGEGGDEIVCDKCGGQLNECDRISHQSNVCMSCIVNDEEALTRAYGVKSCQVSLHRLKEVSTNPQNSRIYNYNVEEKYDCSICDKIVSRRFHQTTDEEETLIKCDVCFKSFTSEELLREHSCINNRFDEMDTTDNPIKTEIKDEDNLEPIQEVLIKEEAMELSEEWERLGDFNEKDAVAFLQEHEVLHNPRKCQRGHNMRLSIGKRNRWLCSRDGCSEFKALRMDTFFALTRLPMTKIILFIYCWTKELTTVKFCEEDLEISHQARGNWCNFLREVCAENLLQNPIVIGGPGKTVEVDVSLFSSRKNNVGPVLRQQWVFGGICRETKECFLVAVDDRSADTLLPIIRNHVRAGSVIISDEWRAYRRIQGRPENLDPQTVNQFFNFVDPKTRAHKKGLGSMWRLSKHSNNIQSDKDRNVLDSYLVEFMWRHRNRGRDLFKQILADIRDYWPPQ